MRPAVLKFMRKRGDGVNILMLSWEYPPHVVGGLAAHVQGLARALVARGHNVTVLSQDGGSPREHEDKGVHVVRAGATPVRSPDFLGYVHQLNHLMLAKSLELVQQGRQFDIIHAHDWIVAFAASGLKQALRRPLIATIHATEFGRNNGLHNDDQRHISDIEWWLVYEAWRVVVCSLAMQAELGRVFQVPPDKVRVIPNGIDVSDMRVRRDMDLRRQYAADDEEIVIFVGRLVWEKGVDTLLYALRQLVTVRPKVKLIVAGRGPIQEEMEALTQRLGLSGHVHFVGHVDAERRDLLYGIAEVAAFPSRYEPFGIVALEAMAAGVPVVVGDVGGLQEIIGNDEVGLRVQPGNAGALSAALLNLLDDRARAQEMASRAREKVERVFTWASVAEQTERVYRRVLEDCERTGWSQPVQVANDASLAALFAEGRYRNGDGRPQASLTQ